MGVWVLKPEEIATPVFLLLWVICAALALATSVVVSRVRYKRNRSQFGSTHGNRSDETIFCDEDAHYYSFRLNSPAYVIVNPGVLIVGAVREDQWFVSMPLKNIVVHCIGWSLFKNHYEFAIVGRDELGKKHRLGITVKKAGELLTVLRKLGVDVRP